MTKDRFEQTVKETSKALLEMARKSCWNSISDNCFYILTNIQVDNEKNLREQDTERIKMNKKKVPERVDWAVNELYEIYSNLYDINFYIYRAEKERTIIEIQYFLKSQLDSEFASKVEKQEPMIHCKLPLPPYHVDNSNQFDINWHFGGWRHKRKMFKLKRQLKRDLKSKNNG